jgi:hypothetical protein
MKALLIYLHVLIHCERIWTIGRHTVILSRYNYHWWRICNSTQNKSFSTVRSGLWGDVFIDNHVEIERDFEIHGTPLKTHTT